MPVFLFPTDNFAYGIRSDYMVEKSEEVMIRREWRIDNYDLNWRLLMATQLLGKSQIGGVYHEFILRSS